MSLDVFGKLIFISHNNKFLNLIFNPGVTQMMMKHHSVFHSVHHKLPATMESLVHMLMVTITL